MRILTPFCFLLMLLLLGIPKEIPAQRHLVDSMLLVLKGQKEDSNKVNTLNELNVKLRSSNPDTALLLSTEALHISERIKWLRGIARSSSGMGAGYRLMGNYTLALKFYFQAVSIQEKLQDKKSLGTNLGNLALVYTNMKDYDNALKFYKRGLDIAYELHDTTSIAYKLGNIGILFSDQGKFYEAQQYYLKAIVLHEKLGNRRLVAMLTGNLGGTYAEQGDSACKAGDSTYAYEEKYARALLYIQNAIRIDEELKDRGSTASFLGNLGILYVKIHKYKLAEKYFLWSLALADSISALKQIEDQERNLSDLYVLTGKPKLAFEYYKKYIISRDAITNSENTKKQTQVEMQYDFDKKSYADSIKNSETKKRDDLKHDQEIQQQKIYSWGGGIGFALMLIVAIVSIRAFRNKQKANQIISLQKLLVEEKQKEILDSIHYAKRIQQSLLPTEKYIDRSIERMKKN